MMATGVATTRTRRSASSLPRRSSLRRRLMLRTAQVGTAGLSQQVTGEMGECIAPQWALLVICRW